MEKTHQNKFVVFAEESLASNPGRNKSPWKILITDDDTEIHSITEKTLSTFTFRGRPLKFLHALSGKEAEHILEQNPDTALILLDIFLEKENAGLDFIRHIREVLGNTITQIVICTGQPDNAPEQSVIEAYEINDYRLKTEMTAQKLYTVVTTSLRSFYIKSTLKKELERRKKSETSLKISEARFRDIANSMGDWIWEIDAQGYYTYSSQGSEAITGYPPYALIGKKFSFLYTDKSLKLPLETIQNHIADEATFMNIEIWISNRDNSRKCLLTSGKPVKDENKKIIGYRGVNKDITLLKESEKKKKKLMSQLRQAQRLEAVGTLAGGIAHDFNNILGSILGYTQLIQMDVPENAKEQHYIKQILEGCNRAKNLILQLLDFSRANSRKHYKAAISPAIIIKEAVKLLRATLPSSISIKTEISDPAGKIMAEPAQIQQVIMNLCTNSLKAMDNNQGTLTIRSEKVNFSPDSPGDLPAPELEYGPYMALSVIDDGHGIEPDIMDKIFNPYFSTRQKEQGSGLGLSVVHGIATECKGAVTVKSAPDKGAEFTLYFPAHTPGEQGAKIDLAVSAGRGQGRILFIDDEKMLVELGKTILDRLGYKTTAMQSPLKALSMIEEDPSAFDIVITDMTMPGIQGITLAEKIKKIRPDMPIILITGISNFEESEDIKSINIDAVLPKPLSINTLSNTLQNLLSR
ncbi:MAG: response regulator [Desulfobacteraceae bacterium]